MDETGSVALVARATLICSSGMVFSVSVSEDKATKKIDINATIFYGPKKKKHTLVLRFFRLLKIIFFSKFFFPFQHSKNCVKIKSKVREKNLKNS